MTNILVVYIFHLVNSRVRFFIRNAVFKSPSIHFTIICNNLDEDISGLGIPEWVRVIRRPNVGFDFGGWGSVLRDGSYANYDRFVFVNSSVIGPFLPPYMSLERWPLIFTEGLSDRIKLFGASINHCRNREEKAHVQSYIFAVNRETLEFLGANNIFDEGAETMTEAVGRELRMSRLVLETGGDIDCLMRIYRNGGWRRPEYRGLDDVMYPVHYNTLWNEYDLVFPKGNRNIAIPAISLFFAQQQTDDRGMIIDS